MNVFQLKDAALCLRAGGGAGGSAQNSTVVNNFIHRPRKSRRTHDSDEEEEPAEENQSRERIHKWLSPPDPSTNHNIACATHLKRTATWFFKGRILRKWKRKGGILWVHGKPGSGKSVLCSTIIEDIAAMCEDGQASMAYFYFDFRNVDKQHLHDLIPSLLIQLSAHSHRHHDILSRLYKDHDDGKTQPSDIALVNYLKQMLLNHPSKRPIYLVMDALDECPDTSGIPSPREQVLQLVRELVDLHLPDLHICVTSRPQNDIRDVLEPLTSFRVSLHDESGQKQDIVDYVKSVVYSDSEQIMKRWRVEDKDLVIEMLSERAGGMFRWVFCQLEVLRYCFPSSLLRSLNELPESLDETYERVLKEIKKPNRDHAHRLLQCLVVAIRPLRVDELAEVLAVDFDDPEGIAKLNPSWRWEDEEQALLSSCSSLITLIDSDDIRSDGSRVVQFSHFSVKEFLTSPRFAAYGGDLSRYHIALGPAHTILARACLSILLRSYYTIENGVWKISPLTGYATQYWVSHARFENVSSRLRNTMERLFDLDKPYFAAWLESYDIDTNPNFGSCFYLFCPIEKPNAAPLYYAALCGFYDLAEHLIAKYPDQVTAYGGYHMVPLVAALAGEHFRIAELLVRNGAGATVNFRGYKERTPLHSAAYYGYVKVVQFLLEHNADVNFRDSGGRTPLHNPPEGGGFREAPNMPRLLADVAELLLQHGADVTAQRDDGWTPLRVAAYYKRVEVGRVLLEHDKTVVEGDNEGGTAFPAVVFNPREQEFEKLLEVSGMSRDSWSRTATR